ncbi:MAG TPA: 2Fe-2S iron-sulfur cluster-binding protein [Acidimicrobiales bacterium]|nr:2Fe-2S iron-sulfur cluster-binding protein [Acidimicrobiales bacterium]
MAGHDQLGPSAEPLRLRVDGQEVEVRDPTSSLLGVLRDELGLRAPKDGCSPQGQCGCCTVLVDGAPRVACVTPVRRVRGRDVTTPDHVHDGATWAAALCATGGSQCGFCTPGIVTRLSALRERKPDAGHEEVEQALLAHLCRCTGWRTILEAWDAYGDDAGPDRDLDAAAARATLEGGVPQRLDPEVALGRAGFADDTAPSGALVAVLDPEGAWTLGESVAEARAAGGKVQGRHTTVESGPPIDVAEGEWALTLQTSWVEPAYLETDASWCQPGGRAASPLGNGGAFGGKVDSVVGEAARHLADEHGRPVRALYSREDTVRLGAKRPPLAAGVRADGTGVVRVARTPGIAEAVRSAAPALEVVEVDVPGPPTSTALRAAGWAEATVLLAGLAGTDAEGWVGPISQPGGGTARARVGDGGAIEVHVDAGDPLDLVALRSYCIGAAHQGASWVTSESIAVDDEGRVQDLTIRSFGVLRAVDTPPIEVTVEGAGPAVPVSDAVFAAVAAAVWLHQGRPPVWPTGIRLRA